MLEVNKRLFVKNKGPNFFYLLVSLRVNILV